MQVENKKSIRGFLRLFQAKGYQIKSRPYELNIVGVRNPSTTPNKFDDKLYAFWKNDSGMWEGDSFPITTDPGTFWLKNPENKMGTAILKEGQYKDSHKLGLHKGQYKALVQQKPLTVMRSYQRDAILDFNNGKDDTGIFGINIHRSSATGTSSTVDNWSAGCQVFANGPDFDKFMALADKSSSLYGNNFTYTLVDERAYLRMLKRRGTYVVAAVLVGVALWIGYRAYKNKSIIPKI